MNIALVQHNVADSPSRAVERGVQALAAAAESGADLVVFPELSFTPFYPRIPVIERPESALDLAEPVPGPTTDTLARAAAKHGVVVVFNLMERDGKRTFDISPVLDADGTLLGRTRMMHITEYEHFHEQGYYAPGDTGAPVYDTAVGRLGVAICYDRHYPEYLRALALQDAELVTVPQAGTVGEWPDGMYEAELRVAALQHGFFTALANRWGRKATCPSRAARSSRTRSARSWPRHRGRRRQSCRPPSTSTGAPTPQPDSCFSATAAPTSVRRAR